MRCSLLSGPVFIDCSSFPVSGAHGPSSCCLSVEHLLWGGPFIWNFSHIHGGGGGAGWGSRSHFTDEDIEADNARAYPKAVGKWHGEEEEKEGAQAPMSSGEEEIRELGCVDNDGVLYSSHSENLVLCALNVTMFENIMLVEKKPNPQQVAECNFF